MNDILSFQTNAPVDRQLVWRSICETYIQHYLEQDDDFLTYSDYLEPFSDETLNSLLSTLLASYFSEHAMGKIIYEQIVSGLKIPEYQIERVAHWFDDSVISLFDVLEQTPENNWLIYNHLDTNEYLVNHRTLNGLSLYNDKQLDQLFHMTLVREKNYYYALENTITLGTAEERLIFSLLNAAPHVGLNPALTKQQQLFFNLTFTLDFHLENDSDDIKSFIDNGLLKYEALLLLENEFQHYSSDEEQHVARHLLGEVFQQMTTSSELKNANINSLAAAITYLLQQEPFLFGAHETQNQVAQRYNVSISTIRKWYRFLKNELSPFIDSYQ